MTLSVRSRPYVPHYQESQSKNETGNKFGTWEVIGVGVPPDDIERPRGVWWTCRCTCGDMRSLRGTDIRRQRTGVREAVICRNGCREFSFMA